MKIHPTAIIDPAAELGRDVEVGAYAYIGPKVQVGEGTRVMHHACIHGYTRIGQQCVIWPYASVGTDPQDLKYSGEESWLEIGSGVIIREFATLNRGTAGGGGITRVGDRCLLMAYSHVAHDCQLGKGVIMANSANLAGHVTLEDHCILGGLVAVHQFTRIGTYCFVGGMSAVNKDLPPYTLCEGNRAVTHGLNLVGLRRAGFSEETINALKQAYRIVFRTRTPLAKALEQVQAEVPQTPEVRHFVEFIRNSERGVPR